MKSLTFRRAEYVSLDGGPGVSTFLDETGEMVFVDMRSLMEQIGLPLLAESDRLSGDEVLVRALQISKDFSYNGGIKQNSLFIPLANINDYLYSIPIQTLKPDVAGNLAEYRQRFMVEADRHWSRLEKSQASQHALDWRRLLVNHNRYQLGQVVKALDGDATEIIQLCLREVNFGAMTPIDNLDARQLDMINLALTLCTDVVVFCVENGQDFDTAMQYIREGIEKHIVPWNF